MTPVRRESWRLLEMRRVQDTRKLREWVAKNFEADPATFEALAYCDFDDPARYPGFDALYESLGTTLDKEDVRFLLRIDVRRRAQDRRGNAFPMGDFSEDIQLQAAIEDILTKRDSGREAIAEYAATFDDRETVAERVATAPGIAPVKPELQRALALIAEAEDGTLSKESVDELREILGRLESDEN